MRYSSEFYFVTPTGVVDIADIPAECRLVEAGSPDEWKSQSGDRPDSSAPIQTRSAIA
jgi:hypothetical protein